MTDDIMAERERWLPVVGFEGYYEVSDRGRVRSVDRVITYRTGTSTLTERDAALAEVERLRGALDRVEQLAECYETATATHTVVSDVTTSYRSCAEDLRNILRGDQ